MVAFDTEKHSNVKPKAEYRRIKKNYKTLEKYKQEKLGQILELPDQGFGIIYRLFTFLFMPLAVFAAFGLTRFIKGGNRIRHAIKISLAVAFLFVIVFALSFQSYSAVVENNNFRRRVGL